MRFRLIPREESFFDLLEKASENLDRASKLLVESLRKSEALDVSAKQLKAVEQDGDKIVHEVMAKLHGTFITPLDREDIHDLISALDDVLDFIEAAADRFALYRVTSIRSQAVQLAEIIGRQAAEINLVIPLLRRITRETILPHCVEINRLENVADGVLRSGLEELFNTATAEPLEVIKWRELYELLEAATDKAEDVADVMEGIVLKNA
jgi:predicted phosphate transport protein (TIGR00153 family)